MLSSKTSPTPAAFSNTPLSLSPTGSHFGGNEMDFLIGSSSELIKNFNKIDNNDQHLSNTTADSHWLNQSGIIHGSSPHEEHHFDHLLFNEFPTNLSLSPVPFDSLAAVPGIDEMHSFNHNDVPVSPMKKMKKSNAFSKPTKSPKPKARARKNQPKKFNSSNDGFQNKTTFSFSAGSDVKKSPTTFADTFASAKLQQPKFLNTFADSEHSFHHPATRSLSPSNLLDNSEVLDITSYMQSNPLPEMTLDPPKPHSKTAAGAAKKDADTQQSPASAATAAAVAAAVNAKPQPSPKKRPATRLQTSAFRGVSCCGKDRKWQVRIRDGNRVLYLGRFPTEIDAALVYDKASRDYKGADAPTNFVPMDEETTERLRKSFVEQNGINPEMYQYLSRGVLGRPGKKSAKSRNKTNIMINNMKKNMLATSPVKAAHQPQPQSMLNSTQQQYLYKDHSEAHLGTATVSIKKHGVNIATINPHVQVSRSTANHCDSPSNLSFDAVTIGAPASQHAHHNFL